MKRKILILISLMFVFTKATVATDDYIGTGTPTINSPHDGAIIEDTVRPELVVNNSFGAGEQDFLEYFFEVSVDSTFPSLFDSSGGVSPGLSTTTSWRMTRDCDSGTRYWWRCKSKSLSNYYGISSEWMIPASFSVKVLDTVAPTIDTTNFGLLINGQDSVVKLIAKDNVGLSKGEFWVKKNGENDNSFRLIHGGGNSTFSDTAVVKDITIPGEYVTPRGVSYKIKVTDSSENLTEVVGYLRVKVIDYIVPFPMWTWKMISFPLKLDESGIDSALGPLENRRVYRWNTVSREYSNTYDTTVDPCDAFWFKIKEDHNSDKVRISVNGISVDPDNVPAISLPSGWSQIANPYCYKVASSKIKVKQDTVEVYVSDTANVFLENQFLTYDYDSATGTKSYLDLTNIPPDIGFWVKNRSDKDVAVIFPKLDADATGLVASPSQKVKNDGWGLKLTAQSKDYIDTNNYIGFLPGAKNDYDFNDLSEPPPVENYVSLYFPHLDWERNNGRYRTDYRACGNFGALEITNFDFVVETNAKEKTVLSWEVINPPLNYCVTLYDQKEDRKLDLSGIKDYSIDWSNGEMRREFSIVVEWDNIFLSDSVEISDLDLNHVIDGDDLSIFGSRFGKMQGENNWNSKADLNKDKIIDGSDLFILGNSFGKGY
ncbi:MAG: hypothetical protein ABII25_08070 [bacterium]